jgi:hypothetical protein
MGEVVRRSKKTKAGLKKPGLSYLSVLQLIIADSYVCLFFLIYPVS